VLQVLPELQDHRVRLVLQAEPEQQELPDTPVKPDLREQLVLSVPPAIQAKPARQELPA